MYKYEPPKAKTTAATSHSREKNAQNWAGVFRVENIQARLLPPGSRKPFFLGGQESLNLGISLLQLLSKVAGLSLTQKRGTTLFESIVFHSKT